MIGVHVFLFVYGCRQDIDKGIMLLYIIATQKSGDSLLSDLKESF